MGLGHTNKLDRIPRPCLSDVTLLDWSNCASWAVTPSLPCCLSSSASHRFSQKPFGPVKLYTARTRSLRFFCTIPTVAQLSPLLSLSFLALEAAFRHISHNDENHVRFSSFGSCCCGQWSTAKMVYQYYEVSHSEIRHRVFFLTHPSTYPPTETTTMVTYTTTTTCPVTSTYSQNSTTYYSTMLSTSTLTVTSCKGGCPTPSVYTTPKSPPMPTTMTTYTTLTTCPVTSTYSSDSTTYYSTTQSTSTVTITTCKYGCPTTGTTTQPSGTTVPPPLPPTTTPTTSIPTPYPNVSLGKYPFA